MAVAVGLLLAFVWLYPQMQLLEDGHRTRAERFRGWLIAAVTALVIGVAGSAIYGAVN
jgi:hypothetical protein